MDRLRDAVAADFRRRTRNLMATIRAVAGASREAAGTVEDYHARFVRRLDALARAQAFLSGSPDGRIALGAVIRVELAAAGAIERDEARDRVSLDGPSEVALRPEKVQLLELALHELSDNAVRHGALARSGGRLAVGWRLDDDDPQIVRIEWRETGGSPGGGLQRGFGRELIEDGLPFQLDASVDYDFGPEGLICTISAPIGA